MLGTTADPGDSAVGKTDVLSALPEPMTELTGSLPDCSAWPVQPRALGQTPCMVDRELV